MESWSAAYYFQTLIEDKKELGAEYIIAWNKGSDILLRFYGSVGSPRTEPDPTEQSKIQ